MSTTLVTGATGLVGHAIVQSLLARERDLRLLARTPDKARAIFPDSVDVVPGDVTDSASVRAAVEGCSVVYHAAGLPEQWLRDETVFSSVNVEGTRNMALAALEAGARFVYTSTIDVFRAGHGESFDESVLDPEPKGTVYERSKQAADALVTEMLSDGLDAVFLHPSAVYGPGPAGSPGINRFVEDLRRGRVPALLPGGMPVVFTEDVGEGHVRAQEGAEPGSRFILSERYVTLRDLARESCDIMGVRVPPTAPLWVARVLSAVTEAASSLSGKPPLIPKGQLHFMQWGARPDSTRARRELDLDFVPLRRGLERLIG